MEATHYCTQFTYSTVRHYCIVAGFTGTVWLPKDPFALRNVTNLSERDTRLSRQNQEEEGVVFPCCDGDLVLRGPNQSYTSYYHI